MPTTLSMHLALLSLLQMINIKNIKQHFQISKFVDEIL